MTLDDFLQAIVADPAGAAATWQVLADWLEDQADSRTELVRLLHQPEYRRDLSPAQREARVRDLLASGMRPVVPSLVNSIGMRFALIPAGKFLMGSPEGEGYDNEHPQHEVEITRPFWLGAFAVTQEQYKRVVGKNPSHFRSGGGGKSTVKGLDTKQFPVESVSWDDVVAFCEKLSSLAEEKRSGHLYRLPSEAEWEYSCLGGATSYSPFSFGDSLSSTQANFNGNHPHGEGAKGPYLERPCPVGSYPANAFGLCDMHGNVWEWCSDWFEENYYQSSDKKDPQGPEEGEARVLRGGSWYVSGGVCRSAYRGGSEPGDRDNFIGFRVVCAVASRTP